MMFNELINLLEQVFDAQGLSWDNEARRLAMSELDQVASRIEKLEQEVAELRSRVFGEK